MDIPERQDSLAPNRYRQEIVAISVLRRQTSAAFAGHPLRNATAIYWSGRTRGVLHSRIVPPHRRGRFSPSRLQLGVCLGRSHHGRILSVQAFSCIS